MSGKWLVRADTGGTFTDGWARRPEGGECRCKVLSSGCLRGKIIAITGNVVEVAGLEDYAAGLLVGWQTRFGQITSQSGRGFTFERSPAESEIGEMLEASTGEEAPIVAARLLTGTPLSADFPAMELRVATTRGTNALLEGKGTEPVLFLSAGFHDLPEIRDQRRPDLFARVIEKVMPITGRIVEVSGRVASDGEVLRPLDESDLRQQASAYYGSGARVAVVAFLHSDRHPAMEIAAARILREVGFDEITISSELGARLGYLSRMETALANGYLSPVLNSFKRRVSERGDVSFLTSAGGLQSSPRYQPVDSLLSGPAGGLVGALAVATAAGYERVLTFDMGGTSTDVARLEGEIAYRYEQAIGPVRVRRPGVRLTTVAAGGGSICRWHLGGLQVGPESAGADPGPACYGRGGPLTVTDVNLLLDYFDESRMEIPLDRAAALARYRELREVMVQAGAEVPGEVALLQGLRAIAVERMAEAVRTISVGEGFDPSRYTLVAFGGAGPQHACELAESLGIKGVLVPADAGLLSAWGLHRAVRESVAERQVLALFSELAGDWETLGISLQEEALAGVAGGTVTRWLAEVRLRGQESTIELVSAACPSLSELERDFGQRYETLFGYSLPTGRELELVMLRAVASEEGEPLEGETFGEGEQVTGLVAADYCTLLAGSGWLLRRGSRGSFLLEREGEGTALGPESAESAESAGVVAAELMQARLESVTDRMGELLRRTALSTNVKERLDFSCAVLDGRGRLVVNAPHIPVHLGALGVCVRRVSEERVWKRGDIVAVNHPAFGGSHLPDVTLVSPVFSQDDELVAFVANRAHHAEIGGKAPGSMPGDAQNLAQEGVVIAPFLLFDGGVEDFAGMATLLREGPYPSRSIAENIADMRAQVAANQAGSTALQALLQEFGVARVTAGMAALFSRASALMSAKLRQDGDWAAGDRLDDGTVLKLAMRCRGGSLTVDFSGSAELHPQNLNATEGVTRSAVLYALRLWVDEDIPLNEGLLERVEVISQGTFLNPNFPADATKCPAVVGGNVETSQRICELVLRALGLGAEGQGTMNNFLFGNEKFGYYETIGGGAGATAEGATAEGDGASGVHVHMTNTAITDPEVLEYRFPVRLHQFGYRKESGGAGLRRGGDGLIREVEFLEEMEVTVLTQHREFGPRGFGGGDEGAAGRQQHWRGGEWRILPPILTFPVQAGERIRIETPGGGGFGEGSW